MVEWKITKKQLESGKKLSKQEWEEALVKCSECGAEETRHFLRDCNDCCGVSCWHEEGKGKSKRLLCCECWNKKNPNEENSKPWRYWLHELPNSAFLTELKKRIEFGRIKIDWQEAYENYNEEDDIQGLYADDFYLSLLWDDEKKHWKERQPLYEFFPSQAERKQKKPSSWRKDVMADWSKENKEFFKREMKLAKGKKYEQQE